MDKNQNSPAENMYREMNYDFLTGLPSMTCFFRLAAIGRKKLQDEGVQTAVLYIDLSGMKYFNLKQGFAAGDRLIIALAQVLLKYFGDENCSRFGQDHFAVYTKADGLENLLKSLFKDCERMNGGNTLPVKVGIYLDSMGDVDVSNACDRAKYACDIKKQGYHSYFTYFSEEMLAQVRKRQYVLDNLDRALEEGWIKTYYQPIVRAANDRVSDEEALARWVDPERGMISPADFIPVLEDSKLIYKVDLRMVENILEKMKIQVKAGLHLVPISVNLSRYDFELCDIVEEVRERVDASGLGRDKLVIEITESVLGNDFDYMKSQIERFQSLGFQVWMDDFGSGYSSLDVLQDIHFDLIKFDMRFMREFENGEKSRIILTELTKMTMALGIPTITEGVETAAQVEFLREIGCTKLQGFYYCKPISLDQLLERYQKGKQIGFENPVESDYYESLGRINLYDLSVVSNEDTKSFQHYFDTIPMAIMETDGEWIRVSRCNKGYRDFLMGNFGKAEIGAKSEHVFASKGFGAVFKKVLCQCKVDGNRAFFDEYTEDGTKIHAFVRRVAVNPVTGVAACAVVILAMSNEELRGLTYAHVAQALSADYVNLYYVNMEDETFIEYKPDTDSEELMVERHGTDFFEASRRDAMTFIYEEDQESFLNSFTKERIEKALAENGSFALVYRLMVNGRPTYVSMKAVRMKIGGKYVVIGVNNVDAQVRQDEIYARIRDERVAYEQILALVGNVICIYTVDPITEHYFEFNATTEYEKLGLKKEGEDFFACAQVMCESVMYSDDVNMFRKAFTKENVISNIKEKGIFSINYRLQLEQRMIKVTLRAGMVKERGDTWLVVGISKQDN